MSLLICTIPRAGSTVFTDVLGSDCSYDYVLHEPDNPQLYESIGSGAVSGGKFPWWEDFNHPEVKELLFSRPSTMARFLYPFSASRYSHIPNGYREYMNSLLGLNAILKVNDGARRLGWYRHLENSSHVICLVRDPRAITASVVSDNHNPFGFWYSESWSVLMEQYAIFKGMSGLDVISKVMVVVLWQYRILMEELTKSEGVLLVRYEDFCNSPMKVIENVYDYLGNDIPKSVISRLSSGDSRYDGMWLGSPHSLSPSDGVFKDSISRFSDVRYDWTHIIGKMSAEDLMGFFGYTV